MDMFVAIVHVITALVLIMLVLLQDSKSNGLGGSFGGGGSNSILGATGATSLAQKLTRGSAIVFACTSLGLTMLSRQNKSVVEGLTPPPAASTTAPATASPTPAPETGAPSSTIPNK